MADEVTASVGHHGDAVERYLEGAARSAHAGPGPWAGLGRTYAVRIVSRQDPADVRELDVTDLVGRRTYRQTVDEMTRDVDLDRYYVDTDKADIAHERAKRDFVTWRELLAESGVTEWVAVAPAWSTSGQLPEILRLRGRNTSDRAPTACRVVRHHLPS